MSKKRSAKLLAGLGMGFLLFSAGCTHDVTTKITSRLNIDDVYADYKLQPTDLSKDSKCNVAPTVKIVNAEKNAVAMNIFRQGIHSYQVVPNQIMDATASYLQSGFQKGGILAADNSAKVLELSLLSLDDVQGMFHVNSKVIIQVSTPDQKISKVFKAEENGINFYTVPSNAIHLATRQIIEDPTIQNYILCR